MCIILMTNKLWPMMIDALLRSYSQPIDWYSWYNKQVQGCNYLLAFRSTDCVLYIFFFLSNMIYFLRISAEISCIYYVINGAGWNDYKITGGGGVQYILKKDKCMAPYAPDKSALLAVTHFLSVKRYIR